MKRLRMAERLFCDFCHYDAEPCHSSCLRCGRDICYECIKTLAKTYQNSVYFSGAGDGVYCLECDIALASEGQDPMHLAYRAVESLRLEVQSWSDDFKKRSEEAERKLKELREGGE